MTYEINGKEIIDDLTHQFFNVFNNTNNNIPNIDSLRNLCIQQTVIISNTDGSPNIYNLDSFIKPRQELLTNGDLTDFSESEISFTMEIFENIAHRFCLYKKSGKLNGKAFYTEGMKTIQFIKIAGEWKICSVAWNDKQEK